METETTMQQISVQDMQEEMKNNPNAMALEDNKRDYEKPINIDAIPDTEKLSSDLLEYYEFTKEPRIVQLLEDGKFGFVLNESCDKFPDLPFHMINLLINEKFSPEKKKRNLLGLIDMIQRLDKIKNGKANPEETQEEYFEDKRAEHLYPQFGGKNAYEKWASGADQVDKPKTKKRREKKLFRKNKAN